MSDQRTRDIIASIETLLELTDDVPLVLREAHDALVEESLDGRRYRWLRKYAVPPTLASIAWGHSFAACACTYPDEAIDVAMREKP